MNEIRPPSGYRIESALAAAASTRSACSPKTRQHNSASMTSAAASPIW